MNVKTCIRCNEDCHRAAANYRAVLEGAGFERLDDLAVETRDCRIVGETAAKRILETQADLDHMKRNYSLFEELAPPDVPRTEFVKWCFNAWEEHREVEADLAQDRAELLRVAEELKASMEREAKMREAMTKIEKWDENYPEDIFPPLTDQDSVTAALDSIHISRDRVSADMARKVCRGIAEFVRAALGRKE